MEQSVNGQPAAKCSKVVDASHEEKHSKLKEVVESLLTMCNGTGMLGSDGAYRMPDSTIIEKFLDFVEECCDECCVTVSGLDKIALQLSDPSHGDLSFSFGFPLICILTLKSPVLFTENLRSVLAQWLTEDVKPQAMAIVVLVVNRVLKDALRRGRDVQPFLDVVLDTDLPDRLLAASKNSACYSHAADVYALMVAKDSNAPRRKKNLERVFERSFGTWTGTTWDGDAAAARNHCWTVLFEVFKHNMDLFGQNGLTIKPDLVLNNLPPGMEINVACGLLAVSRESEEPIETFLEKISDKVPSDLTRPNIFIARTIVKILEWDRRLTILDRTALLSRFWSIPRRDATEEKQCLSMISHLLSSKGSDIFTTGELRALLLTIIERFPAQPKSMQDFYLDVIGSLTKEAGTRPKHVEAFVKVVKHAKLITVSTKDEARDLNRRLMLAEHVLANLDVGSITDDEKAALLSSTSQLLKFAEETRPSSNLGVSGPLSRLASTALILCHSLSGTSIGSEIPVDWSPVVMGYFADVPNLAETEDAPADVTFFVAHVTTILHLDLIELLDPLPEDIGVDYLTRLVKTVFLSSLEVSHRWICSLRYVLQLWLKLITVTSHSTGSKERVNTEFMLEVLPPLLKKVSLLENWEANMTISQIVEFLIRDEFPSTACTAAKFSKGLLHLDDLGVFAALRNLGEDEDSWDLIADSVEMLQSVVSAQGLKTLQCVTGPKAGRDPCRDLTQGLTDNLAWLFSMNTSKMMEQALLVKDLYKAKPLLLLDDLLRGMKSDVDADCY